MRYFLEGLLGGMGVNMITLHGILKSMNKSGLKEKKINALRWDCRSL